MDNESAIKSFNNGVISIDGTRSDKQENNLREFMHKDFENWNITDGRGGGMYVAYPPTSIAEHKEWDDSLNKIIAPEWHSLHPQLRRRKIITRFVPKLYDFKAGVEIGGIGTIPIEVGNIKEHWIRISILNGGDLESEKSLLFTLAHEIAEIDFWKKTTPRDWLELHNEDILGTELLKQGRNHEYRQLTDEEIANLRAERALKRKWADFSFPTGR